MMSTIGESESTHSIVDYQGDITGMTDRLLQGSQGGRFEIRTDGQETDKTSKSDQSGPSAAVSDFF